MIQHQKGNVVNPDTDAIGHHHTQINYMSLCCEFFVVVISTKHRTVDLIILSHIDHIGVFVS